MKLKNPTILFLILFLPLSLYAQWDEFFKAFGKSSYLDSRFNVGLTSLIPSNPQMPLLGLQLNYGIIDDRDPTFFYIDLNKSVLSITMRYYMPHELRTSGNITANTANPLLTNPIEVFYNFHQKCSYLMLDIREDYYFLTSKNESFSFYGGWFIGVNVPFYRGNYTIDSYDENNYTLITPTDWKEKTNNIYAILISGIQIGFEKYIGAFSSIFFESSLLFHLKNENITIPAFIIDDNILYGFHLGYQYEF